MVRFERTPAVGCLVGMLLIASLVSCDSSSGGPGTGDPVPGAASNADDLSVLVTAVGLENEALAELLAIFSNDGTKALFAPDLDWSDATALDAYDRLDALAAKLREHKPALEAALASLEAKQQAAFAKGSGAGRARYALSLSSFFPSIFGWADGAPKAERENIVKVLEHGGDATKAEVYTLATELLEQGRLGDPGVDLGGSPEAFYQKLKSGALDGQISMHNLNKDAGTNADGNYGAIAGEAGARPGDVAASQGAKGLVAGGNSYWDLAKRTVGAGFAGVSAAASAAFEKGTALAEGALEKIEQAEAFVTAPIDFVKGEIAGALQERVTEFLGEKTGLDGGTAATLVEGLGEDLQGWMQQTATSKEVANGAAPEAVYGTGIGWGGLSLENAEDLTGALVTWLDEATGTVKALVSPGPFEAGEAIVMPATSGATVVGLGDGQDETPAVEGVEVTPDQSTALPLPDLAGAEPQPEPDTAGPDTTPPDAGASGVYLGCLSEDGEGTTYGCIAYQGDETDPESTEFLDNASLQCQNAGYRLYAGLATEGEMDCRAWCSAKEGSYGFKACDTPGEPVLAGPCTGVVPGNDVCHQSSCYNCCGDCSNGHVLIYECMSGCTVSDGGPGGTALCECN